MRTLIQEQNVLSFFFLGGGVMVVPNSQQGVDDMVRQLEMFVFSSNKKS